MENKSVTIIYTPPGGDLPISLKDRCFHEGIPAIAIIVDWKLDMDAYGLENGWKFSAECLEIWLREEYSNHHSFEIIAMVKQFESEE